MNFISKLFGSSNSSSSPKKEGGASSDLTSFHSPPSFDLKDEGFVQNPYPLFAQCRKDFPVLRSSLGSWVITRYADVAFGFTDKRLGNAPSPFAVVHSRNKDKYVCADVASNIIPYMDAPLHNAPRRLIARTFHSHLTHNPLPIFELAKEILSELKSSGEEVDLVSDFGTPLSVYVLCDLLGLPREDEAQLKEWTESFFYLFASIPSEEVRQKVDEALVEFRSYLKRVVDERKVNPKNDFISALIAAEDQGQKLTNDELVDNCMLLFADGVENVDTGIGNAIVSLLQQPEQWELLKSNHALISSAVDECLRFESPAQFVGKVALEDIEWHGQLIKKHSGVLLMVGSANRDEDQFLNPDQLDIKRNPNNHLAFGKGRHSCVGAYLVKTEMEAAFLAIREVCPKIQLTCDSFEWEPRLAHRWIKSAPVKLS